MVEISTISAVTLALSGAGLAILRGWNWTSRSRLEKAVEDIKVKRAAILEGTYQVRTQHDSYERVSSKGGIACAMIGSFGSTQLPDLIRTFDRMDIGDHLGGILLAQLNDQERDQCIDVISVECSAYLPRITQMSYPNLPGGFHGRTHAEAMDIKDQWIGDCTAAVREWLRTVERTTLPELLLLFVSPGAHSVIVPTIMRLFRDRYKTMPVYVVTVVDDRDVRREQFADAHKAMTQAGRGIIINDNRRRSRNFDSGVIAMLAGLSAGGWIGNKNTQLGNVLAEVFSTQRPERHATVSIWMEDLPVYHLPAEEGLEEVYYTSNLVEEKAVRGIKAVYDDRTLQGMALERAGETNSSAITVLVPILPEPDLAQLIKRVEANLVEWQAMHRNVTITYASIAPTVDANTTEVNIAVILLQPIAGSAEVVEDFVMKEPARKFLNEYEKSIFSRKQLAAPSEEQPSAEIVTQRGGRPRRREEE